MDRIKSKAGTVALGFLLAFVLGLLWLSRPTRLGLTRGSVTVTSTTMGGEEVTVVDGNGINFLGQVQGVGLRPREGNEFLVEAYYLFWHPFAQLSTHREWPIVIPHDDLTPGTYTVRYWNRGFGYLTAGTFVVRERKDR